MTSFFPSTWLGGARQLPTRRHWLQLLLVSFLSLLTSWRASAQSVTSFTLLNADTDQPLAGYDPLPNGATLNLAALPTRNLSIRANTNTTVVRNLLFGYDDNPSYQLENTAPYAIAGYSGSSSAPDYRAWTPTVGSHSLKATPYAPTGAAGTPLTITFIVADGPATSGALRNPDNAANLVAGLDYAYYEGAWEALPNFVALTPVRTGIAPELTLSPRLRNEDYALRFSGYVTVPTDGQYTFFTNSDDGSQLLIGNELVVNNNGRHEVQERSGTIGLKAGTHALTVLYFQHTAKQMFSVSYEGPGLAKTVLPTSALLRSGALAPVLRNADNVGNPTAGLDYAYYEGTWKELPDFTTLTPAKSGTASTFDLSPRLRNDDFAFRYTGFVRVPTDGLYSFYTSSDDGSQLFIGDQLVVNNDEQHVAREMAGVIGLKAGLHAITVLYFETNGSQDLEVSYAGPGLSKAAIPASALVKGVLLLSTAAGRKGTDAVQLYPNPARDVTTLSLPAKAGETLQVDVRDALARRVAHTSQRATAGTNKVLLPLSALPAGVYTVTVEHGAERTVCRLVVAP